MKGSDSYTRGYLDGLLNLTNELPEGKEAQVDYQVGQQDAKFFLMEALGRLGIVEVAPDVSVQCFTPRGSAKGTVHSDRNSTVLVGGG